MKAIKWAISIMENEGLQGVDWNTDAKLVVEQIKSNSDTSVWDSMIGFV